MKRLYIIIYGNGTNKFCVIFEKQGDSSEFLFIGNGK